MAPMTCPPPAPHEKPPPRPRGRLGLWSDRVKAALLLVMLAMAGGLAGLGGSGTDAERLREGLSAGGPSLRPSPLPDMPALVTAPAPDRQSAGTDGGGDGDAPPRALAAAEQAFPAPCIRPVILARAEVPVRAPARAGHDTRMTTGPPRRLSL
ncbi:hypothetical protein [Niveispirillum fermenti]|uniref:hypothetical protein n=1 Tax=Niveispirillum fermenti TaxID=1233113 RepID=UPI003A871D2D